VVKLKVVLIIFLLASIAFSQTLAGKVQVIGKTTIGGGVDVTLITANLQHGQNTANNFNFTTQVNSITPNADIVAVQERTTSETGWDSALASAGFSQAVFKAHIGSPGDGNAIWIRASRVTAVTTYSFDLTNGANPTSGSTQFGWDGTTDIRRSGCAIKAQVGSKQFYVVAAHMVSNSGEDSSNTNFAAQRVDQINSLNSWIISNLTGGLPIVVAGDFNTPPNYPRAPERTYTADASTDVITSTAHGFTDGTAVSLRNSGGTQPSPLLVGDSLYALATVYYVRDSTTNTFKLAASPGGAPIDLTTNGTGSNFVSATQWDLMRSGYYDLWQEGLANGTATVSWGDRDADGIQDMPLDFQLTRTHDTRRIDYVWLNRSAQGVTLKSITVPDGRANCSTSLTLTGAFKECPDVVVLVDRPDDDGIRFTDHNIVQATLNFQ